MVDDKEKFEQIEKQREQMMADHGWIVDVVESGMVNIHTHGLEKTYKHPDLQCVLPIDPQIAHSILCTIVGQISNGKVFKSGKCYGGLVKSGYKIRFMAAEESGRKVLRIILPDKNGKLHKNLMEESLRIQYNGITKEKKDE